MSHLLKLTLEDRPRALRELGVLLAQLPEAAGNRLDLLLATSPAPEQALHYFTSLRERQPLAYRHFVASENTLRFLTGIFSYSRFLSEELLEHPGWAVPLLDPDGLQLPAVSEDLRQRLERSLPPGLPDPVDLARFRRRQILRILARDIFAFGTLPQITGELSTLADVIVGVSYARIHRELVLRHGVPRGAGGEESHFAVIALGKLGAEELNYSSDIDLMFLYSEGGNTDGPDPITNREFFERASNQLTGLLSTHSPAGLCYRVDLRLRPYGTHGDVCISLDYGKQYYEKQARDWELQMLIKARVAAGHLPTGLTLLEFVQPLIYSTSLDFSAIEALSATRERLNEKLGASSLRRKSESAIDLKLHRGGIRDIEFLVQCLQRLQPGTEAWLQHPATLLALARLQDKGIITDADYGRLASAYQFLRHLEHRLQVEEDLQTHTLPTNPRALDRLARRMPRGGTAAALLRDLYTHFAFVSAIYDRVIHLERSPETSGGSGQPHHAGLQSASVLATLTTTAPQLAAAFARAGLRRGGEAFEHFVERLSDEPGSLARLDADANLTNCALDLFEHSPFLAEQLVRRPGNVEEIAQPFAALLAEEPPLGASELRVWYQRAILRIEAESVCRSHPVFDTLIAHSAVADAVIAHVYRIAIGDLAGRTPGIVVSEASAPMNVIALGRLGMHEFDVGSDADVIFVLADSAADQLEFWTKVAERVVQLIGAYTGEGRLFTVDTRLRPNGAAGPLVQTASSVIEYFAKTAEPWESLTYLKARAVAGEVGS